MWSQFKFKLTLPWITFLQLLSSHIRLSTFTSPRGKRSESNRYGSKVVCGNAVSLLRAGVWNVLSSVVLQKVLSANWKYWLFLVQQLSSHICLAKFILSCCFARAARRPKGAKQQESFVWQKWFFLAVLLEPRGDRREQNSKKESILPNKCTRKVVEGRPKSCR